MLEGLFKGLYVFGDSISDYGSRAALAQRDVFETDADPAWSGVTYNNGRRNWQTRLSHALGIKIGRLTDQPDLPVDPYALYANESISPLNLGKETRQGPSYAIGGATTGVLNFNQVGHPDEAAELGLVNKGMASLMAEAFGAQALRLRSDDLAVVWGGGNDLLVSFAAEQPLDELLAGMLTQLQRDLETTLRFSDARQVVLAAVAPIRGEVNGVSYQSPFLSAILLAAQSGVAPAWLDEWAQQVGQGALEQLRVDVAAMVEDVARMFPYANIINFNPEYQAQYEQFGQQLGDFSAYGITNTLGYAQAADNAAPVNSNAFLYFDTIHPTGSAHHMLADALALNLRSARRSIKAATFRSEINSDDPEVIGSPSNDRIQAGAASELVLGRAGNDSLTGLRNNVLLSGGPGDDVLAAGPGHQRLSGGLGADLFVFSAADLDAKRDRILDFNPAQGDRLGITAVLGLDASLAGETWQFIGTAAFSGTAAQLRFANGVLSGDRNGDGRSDLSIALSQITAFDPAWIS
jgi:phospholipase/lecithinase/hemolysin